jgi:hypothetical protein
LQFYCIWDRVNEIKFVYLRSLYRAVKAMWSFYLPIILFWRWDTPFYYVWNILSLLNLHLIAWAHLRLYFSPEVRSVAGKATGNVGEVWISYVWLAVLKEFKSWVPKCTVRRRHRHILWTSSARSQYTEYCVFERCTRRFKPSLLLPPPWCWFNGRPAQLNCLQVVARKTCTKNRAPTVRTIANVKRNRFIWIIRVEIVT